MIEQAFKALKLFPWHIPPELTAKASFKGLGKSQKPEDDEAAWHRACLEADSALERMTEVVFERKMEEADRLRGLQLQPQLQASLTGAQANFDKHSVMLMSVYQQAHDMVQRGEFTHTVVRDQCTAVQQLAAALEEADSRVHLVLFQRLSLVCSSVCYC